MRGRHRCVWIGAAVVLLAACSSGSGDSRRTSPSTSTTPRTTTTGEAATSTTGAPAAGPQWATYYHDASRSGVAADGPASPRSVERQWSSPALDGPVYAQPLVVGDQVVIATENDTVYSLNASDGTVKWKTHLGEPIAGSSLPCGNVDPVGITSTPVVDTTANRIYAVGMVQPGRHVLFALELSTGRLVDSVRVDAPGADPAVHNQRSALTLSHGKVFVPFGGRFGDCGNYKGRVVSVPVSGGTLGKAAAYTLPTQRAGGFWAPPGAVVAGDGSLYLASGNSFDSGKYDYGNSVVHLSSDLKLLGAFAPTNWQVLNGGDVDLGSTSPVVLPDGRVFQVGKAGFGYLLGADDFSGPGDALHSARICSGSAFGGVAHEGNTLFVPCTSGVVQVTVAGNSFRVGWTETITPAGPTIVSGGAVWVVATASGDLLALDTASGATLSSHHIGSVPSRFTSPGAGGGRVVVAAGDTVLAFG